MAEAIRAVANPANTNQRYVLWDSGRIDPIGGALPITGTPTFFTTAPLPTWGQPLKAIQIVDWTTPSGYVCDYNGTVTAFGGATAPAAQAVGVPFAFPVVTDFYMNPLGNGQGYILTAGGAVIEFGGASAVPQPAATNINTGQYYRRLIMETFGGRYYAMTSWGLIYDVNGAGLVTTVDGGGFTGGPRNAFWPSWSIARAIRIYDFVHGYGWMLDGWGGIHNLNGAEVVFGQHIQNVNYWQGWDIARDLVIVDNGTGPGPLTTLTLDGLGPLHQIISSTAPTVAVTGPTGTITTTTRPTIQWSYSDAEGDAQQSYHVKVFSHAQWSAGGFDPATATPTYEVTASSETVFFHVPLFDFPNDSGNTWRAYVQVTDTSGLASTWQFSAFIMNTTPPPTPTLTITNGTAYTAGVTVQITTTSPPVGTLAALEYQDNDELDEPWRYVRGRVGGVTQDAIDLNPNVTIVDDEPRYGIIRRYRARTYQNPTGNSPLLSPYSSIGTGQNTDRTVWTLTAPVDSTLGGKVHVIPDTFVANRPIIGSAVQPVGRRNAIVFVEDTPKGIVGDLQLTTPLPADHAMIEALLESGDTLYLRDPYGRGFYIQPVYDSGGHLRGATGGIAAWKDTLVSAPPDCGEDAPNGSGFLTHQQFPFVEVDRPLAGVDTGTLAPL